MIATKQAQEILDNATNEANSLRVSAMGYADDQLHEIEEVLSNSIETSQARYDSLISSLQGFLDVVTKNRAQLFPQTEAAEEQPLLPDRQQSLQRSRRLPIFQLQMRMPRKSKGIQHPTVNSKRIIFCNT